MTNNERSSVNLSKASYISNSARILRIKLPTINCPSCDAKNLLFAGSKEVKNKTIVELFCSKTKSDYVLICPKCKKYISVSMA